MASCNALMNRKDVKEALLKVKRMLVRELGVDHISVDQAMVPDTLHSLIPLASAFGIGDDGTREEAVEKMPRDFIDDVCSLLDQHKHVLNDWLQDDGDWTDEKNAFSAFSEAFWDARSGSTDASEPVSDSDVARVSALIGEISRVGLRNYRR